jgi:hypothetical protein
MMIDHQINDQDHDNGCQDHDDDDDDVADNSVSDNWDLSKFPIHTSRHLDAWTLGRLDVWTLARS